jgi:hypothetical protein
MSTPRIGWINHLLGDNCITKYGPGAMIAVGWLLVQRGAAERRASKMNAQLEVGEVVVLTTRDLSGVLTLTNRRLRYNEANLDAYRQSIKSVPAGEVTVIALADIAAVRAVRQNEVTSTSLAAMITRMWGVSITLQDGSIVNLPVSDAETIALRIATVANSTRS